jgi:hypothetical protein
MMILELTRDDILKDIEAYEERIRNARDKLSGLPAAGSTLKERKKIKIRRHTLLSEIDHVRGLISIAEQALNQV